MDGTKDSNGDGRPNNTAAAEFKMKTSQLILHRQSMRGWCGLSICQGKPEKFIVSSTQRKETEAYTLCPIGQSQTIRFE